MGPNPYRRIARPCARTAAFGGPREFLIRGPKAAVTLRGRGALRRRQPEQQATPRQAWRSRSAGGGAQRGSLAAGFAEPVKLRRDPPRPGGRVTSRSGEGTTVYTTRIRALGLVATAALVLA